MIGRSCKQCFPGYAADIVCPRRPGLTCDDHHGAFLVSVGQICCALQQQWVLLVRQGTGDTTGGCVGTVQAARQAVSGKPGAGWPTTTAYHALEWCECIMPLHERRLLAQRARQHRQAPGSSQLTARTQL